MRDENILSFTPVYRGWDGVKGVLIRGQGLNNTRNIQGKVNGPKMGLFTSKIR